MARELKPAVAYLRTSSAANVGADKDSASVRPLRLSPSVRALQLWARASDGRAMISRRFFPTNIAAFASFAFVLLLATGSAFASNAEDAVEFILTGDAGWEGMPFGGYTDVIALKDCKTSFSFAESFVRYDWNKVIWNSARIEQRGSSFLFRAGCKGECSCQGKCIPGGGLWIGFSVAPERFQKALRVLIDACPGVETKF